MSFGEHRPVYIRLMDELVAGKLAAKDFVATYKALWMADCKAEHDQIATWDEAYDEQLLERFHSGAMDVKELASRMRALFGITDSEARAREFIHRTVTACDFYRASMLDVDGGEFYGLEQPREDYHLDDAALVVEVTAVLADYKNRNAQKQTASSAA